MLIMVGRILSTLVITYARMSSSSISINVSAYLEAGVLSMLRSAAAVANPPLKCAPPPDPHVLLVINLE